MKTLNSSTACRSLLASAALAAACLLIAVSALAQSFTVTSVADTMPGEPTVAATGSLRQAIESAFGAIFTIDFDPRLFQNGPATITLTGGELLVNKPNTSVLIYGPSTPLLPLLTVSGNNSSRVFEINAGSYLWMIDLAIAGGLETGPEGGANNSDTFGGPTSGGGILNNGTLSLWFCTITGNSAIGGQFVNSNNGGNGGDADGGGIANFGRAVLGGCTISGNTATGGQTMGGGYNLVNQFNTSYGGNGCGGGIYNQGALMLGACTVSDNQANGADEDSNGGWWDYGGSGRGGGIFCLSSGMALTNCTIANNTASGGNSLYKVQLDLFLSSEGSGIPGNGMGGGICSQGSSVFLDSCTISGNTASGGNLDPESNPGGTAGSAYGGGISCSVYFPPPSPASPGVSGVFTSALPTPTLANTIIAGNFVFPGSAPSSDAGGSAIGLDVSGTTGPQLTVNSGGHNLIGLVDASSGWIGSDHTGLPPELDSDLGPLVDNGGPTFTMAPGPGSPTLGQGSDTIGGDQRGLPRPLPPNPCDIGAYQSQPPGPPRGHLSVYHPSQSLIKLTWTYLPTGTLSTAISPVLGLRTIPVGDLGSGEWTPFSGTVRYYNVNNQFVATDRIGDGPGMIYQLAAPPTNIVFIRPAATIPATLITSSNATLNGTTTPYGSNALYWFEYGANTAYGMNTPTNSLTTVTNPGGLAGLSQPIGGLNPATLYHYQLVVTDDDGTQCGGDSQFATPALGTTYIGNSLTVSNGAPDGAAPLVILGEYSSAGPLTTASPATTLPAGTVQDVKFYGQNYNFTMYALSYFSGGRSTNEQTFQVVAAQSFGGTNSTPGIRTLAVTNFPVYAGNLLAFAGRGPYYPQNPNDATNSDATYENASNPGSGTATPPVGQWSSFSVGVHGDAKATYGYITNLFGNQGRTYAIGVDVSSIGPRPMIRITSPADGTSVTNKSVVVQGTASSSVGIASVYCRVDAGAWSVAQGTTNWSFLASLTPETNVVQAFAADSAGNFSPIDTVRVIYAGTPQPTNQCVTPPSGLAYWWPGEGNALDIVGGNNGTLEGGVTYANGEVGQAFNLDGRSGFISTSLLVTNPQTFTLSLWFKTATTQGGVLVSFDSNRTNLTGSSYDRNIYMDNTGAIHFGVWNSGAKQINSAASYNDNNWHQVVGTLSASTGLSLYVDGLLVGNNSALTNAEENYNGWWRIGEDNLNNWPFQPASYYFKGQIDEVAIFNNALSLSEVAAIHAAGSAGMCKSP